MSCPEHLVVHACYHKCMTVYFDRVLRQSSRALGLRYEYVERGASVSDGTQCILSPHSDLDPASLPEFSGSHMIRDPRDVLLSAYHYHLRTDEEWCAKPNPHHTSLPPDVSYQQHLHSLSMEDGLLYELGHVTGRIIEMMGAWDYDDPRFLELRFEDVVNNEKASFERIFSWHGFSGDALDTIVGVAESRSLARLPSSDSDAKHARPGSGRGQWRDVFTPKVKSVFKEKYGDILIQLGYAKDNSW